MSRTIILLLLSSLPGAFSTRCSPRFGWTSSLTFAGPMSASLTYIYSGSISSIRMIEHSTVVVQHAQLMSPSRIPSHIRMEVASSRPDNLPTLSAANTSELFLLLIWHFWWRSGGCRLMQLRLSASVCRRYRS